MLRGEKINSKAFIEFISGCTENGIFPHSLRYYKAGKLMCGADFAPYTGSEKMHLYSLSKSFTSAAVGIACGEGLLDVSMKMKDIFPEKMPEFIDEKLAEMTLSDVLSMQSGHERCNLDKMISTGDSLKTFFGCDMVYKPGTTFVYSTGGTMVCGAAVTRVTGMPLADYLYEKLFKYIGVEKPRWDVSADGIAYGGVGIYLSADDIASFGMLLAENGRKDGMQLVPEDYIKDATKPHSIDINNGSPDWISGYGYQFWINARGGFRGDGAFGQLCIVLPETKEVFVILCECGNMQKEMDLIFDFLKKSENADLSEIEKASAICENLYAVENPKAFNGKLSYIAGENKSRIFGFDISGNGDKLRLDIKTDYGTQQIIASCGSYAYSKSKLMALSPAIAALHKYGSPEEFNAYATYTATENGIDITIRHADLPHTVVWHFGKDKLTLTQTYGDLPQNEITLKQI